MAGSAIIADLERHLRSHPDDATAWRTLGALLLRLEPIVGFCSAKASFRGAKGDDQQHSKMHASEQETEN